MLNCIIISVVLGICSTVFVFPWFWISLITRKTIVNDGTHPGIKAGKNEKQCFFKRQLMCFIFVLMVSMLLFTMAGVRRTWTGAFIPICLIIFINILRVGLYENDKNEKIKERILGGVLVAFAIFSITKLCIDYDTKILERISPKEIPVFVSIQKDGQQVVPSSDTIKELFDVDSASGPMYTNHKFVYKVSGRSGLSGSLGIVIIDERNADKAKLIECKLNKHGIVPLKMRNMYPTDIILYQDIQVSDDDVPYEKYWLVKGENFFSKPTLQKYLLRNLETGEITEYLPEELPEFAR